MPSISIDWLQISTKTTSNIVLLEEMSANNVFKLVKKDIRHNIFKSHLSIESNITGLWEPCAVFSYQALSGILPPDIGHLKIINKYLYQSYEDILRLVNTILIELKLKFHGVSRLDIAYDFKQFNRLTVPQFFRSVAKGKLLKRRSCSLHIDGKATRNLDIHYMRFGSNSSPLQFYIYNKSKELREKTEKPYIRDRWKLNGCDDKHKDTYRIEFVLHPSKNGVIDFDEDGVVQKLIPFTSIEIINQNFIENLFWSLINKHFVFCINDGQVKKERMKIRELFFKKNNHTSLFERITDKTTSNRTDKMLIKKMACLWQAWRTDHGNDIPLRDAITNEIDKKGLNEWAEKNMLWDQESILQVTKKTESTLDAKLQKLKLERAKQPKNQERFISTFKNKNHEQNLQQFDENKTGNDDQLLCGSA